jgi:hypothetical protein
MLSFMQRRINKSLMDCNARRYRVAFLRRFGVFSGLPGEKAEQRFLMDASFSLPGAYLKSMTVRSHIGGVSSAWVSVSSYPSA